MLNALRHRYAVRKFIPSEKLSNDEWKILEEALVLTPSGYGLQPWKFIVVQDPVLRQKLKVVSLNQSQIEDCSHLVVFAAKTVIDESYVDSYISQIARVRNVSKESLQGYFEMMVNDLIKGPKSRFVSEWAARQAYIALGNLVTTAALLNIGACPLEGIEPEKYDEILNMKSTGYRTLVACALGRGSPEDKYATLKKVRFDKERVVSYL